MSVMFDSAALARPEALRHIRLLTMEGAVPKVINMGAVKNLLTEWERVRQAILAGRVSGFYATLMDDLERETIYMGGVYQKDTSKAARACLRMSAARMMGDEPPQFQASRY